MAFILLYLSVGIKLMAMSDLHAHYLQANDNESLLTLIQKQY